MGESDQKDFSPSKKEITNSWSHGSLLEMTSMRMIMHVTLMA
jgi:hypothetical protein